MSYLGQKRFQTQKEDSLWSIALRKLLHDRIGIVSCLVVLFYLFLALGVWMHLWGNEWEDILNENGYGGISSQYWLGTNLNGQDIFQRTLYSIKIAFQVGGVVAFFSVLIGAFLGSVAGFYRGTVLDELIIWLYGCLDAIPFYLFVAAVAFALQDTNISMYISMIGVMWTSTCKIVRGQVMKLRQLEFVEAAKAMGRSNLGIILIHIFPNTIPILLVELSIAFVTAIKTEAILSFLGLGLKNGVSWGVMLAEASAEVGAGIYHNFLAASIFMFGLVMAFNQFADALQDALDPQKVGLSN